MMFVVMLKRPDLMKKWEFYRNVTTDLPKTVENDQEYQNLPTIPQYFWTSRTQYCGPNNVGLCRGLN